jgi:hypothetical protein
MKSIAIIATLTFSSLISSAASPIDVVHSKYKNLFVFTTKKAMRGADVKVYYSNGDLVTTQKMKKRKMIIDFCDTKSGSYTIVVQKGKSMEEFHYVRK